MYWYKKSLKVRGSTQNTDFWYKCAGYNQALIYKEQHDDVLFIQVIYPLFNVHSLSVNHFWHEHYPLHGQNMKTNMEISNATDIDINISLCMINIYI